MSISPLFPDGIKLSGPAAGTLFNPVVYYGSRTFLRTILIWLIPISLYFGTVGLAQTSVIFDTDIGSDCDDAGALAVLHKLADDKEINILGTIFSSNANPYGIGTIAAINRYYGREDLSLGQYQGPAIIGDPNDTYTRYIAAAQHRYGHKIMDKGPELVQAYKTILQEQPNESVTIITVGHPVGLFYLIHDEEGLNLVKTKVTKWIAMTHTDQTPQNDWNFGKNGTAMYITGLLKMWPTAAYFSGSGKDIITGHVKLPETSGNNPVRKSYELWGNNALKNGRSSWDQIAVLFAARPEYFTLEKGELKQNNRMETFWTPDGNQYRSSQNHFKVIPSIGKQEMEGIIEAMMSEEPMKRIGRE